MDLRPVYHLQIILETLGVRQKMLVFVVVNFDEVACHNWTLGSRQIFIIFEKLSLFLWRNVPQIERTIHVIVGHVCRPFQYAIFFSLLFLRGLSFACFLLDYLYIFGGFSITLRRIVLNINFRHTAF